MARWWQGEINMDLLWRRIIFSRSASLFSTQKTLLWAFLRCYTPCISEFTFSRLGQAQVQELGSLPLGLPGSFAILPFGCELRSFLDDSSSWFLLVDLRTLRVSFLCLRFPSCWVVIVDNGLCLHPSCIGSSFMLLVIRRLDVVGMLCFWLPYLQFWVWMLVPPRTFFSSNKVQPR